MRTYLPTFGILASIVTGCAGGNATTEEFADGGPDVGLGTLDGAGKDGGGKRDGQHIVLSSDSGGNDVAHPQDTGSGQDSPGSTDGASMGDTGVDSGGPKQMCVHNTDCMAPNLCAGNNGMACLGGFCVATNMPMNCDDGVPCTTDACNANTNTCTHTVSDTACPTGEYCDPVMNCVAMLPCTAGDGVCDRLDTTVCAGLWSCDPTLHYCVHGGNPCPARANATATCGSATMPIDGGVTADAGVTADGGEIKAECAWTCQTGYVDSNGDLDAPIGTTSNGCECQDTNPIDLPDLNFTDTNCDGIDGTVADAIFVDGQTGNDTNPGTMAMPKKTIQAGVNAAGTQASPMGFPSSVKDVYVSEGLYDEHISMVNGVSIYGGYNAANHWSRALSNLTLIASPTNVAIDAKSLSKPFTIQLMSITAQAASGTAANGGGASSYGVRVVSCSGGATITACNITVNAGAAAPSTQATGTTGATGGNGVAGVGEGMGAGGPSTCSAAGGPGGPGVGDLNGGITGSTGSTAPGGGTGAQGGPGGGAGSCSTFSASNGDPGNPAASPGNPGSAGTNASVGSAVGTFDASGNYLPAAGSPGVSAGFAGGGGGGGGSGGGTQHGCGIGNVDCCTSDSGGGGGGGAGGCGGGLGGGGVGGGGSFAVLIVSSQVASNGNTLNVANGGNGGPGANGGAGGGGGTGAGGGGATNSGDHPAGNGGSGSAGGGGGKGGAGSGGPGGPSACFAYSGTSPASAGDTCNAGSGGSGGMGGSNGLAQAPSGPTGSAGTVDVP